MNNLPISKEINFLRRHVQRKPRFYKKTQLIYNHINLESPGCTSWYIQFRCLSISPLSIFTQDTEGTLGKGKRLLKITEM